MKCKEGEARGGERRAKVEGGKMIGWDGWIGVEAWWENGGVV